MKSTIDTDFLVIGAGIAGASIASSLAKRARVMVLEREAQPGYHSTGRSAALFAESYGPRQVRALTCASRDFLHGPPPEFSDTSLVGPRGALFVASPEQGELLDAQWQVLKSQASIRRIDSAETLDLVPVLRHQRVAGAVYDCAAADINVNALHQGYLRELRRRGGTLICQADVVQIGRSGPHWSISANGAEYRAGVIVNAAGAWADQIALLAGVAPIGIEPRRRSAFLFAPPSGMSVACWPMMIGIDESWYVKPEAGLLLGSPANADLTDPQDVQPDELDVAVGIDRIESMTNLAIQRPLRAWAGLRSFVADGGLVGGYDDNTPGFFWVVGQGGYGIQTSPAMGEACAAIALGRDIPGSIADCGIDIDALSPRRLRKSDLAIPVSASPPML